MPTVAHNSGTGINCALTPCHYSCRRILSAVSTDRPHPAVRWDGRAPLRAGPVLWR
nr:MAG TPA: hypothetical protein [Caudoviricetes sp.]DAU14741.1 MAG TPA: hypothetical protein [Caudoviricetes sp.]